VREVDLAGWDAAGQAAALEHLLAEERRRFDLGRAPLLRLLLVRLGGGRHRLVLTNHHILLDGWSTPILLRELLALQAEGEVLAPVTPYRDYLGWLQRQDRAAAEQAWREAPRRARGADRWRDASTAPGIPETIWRIFLRS